MKNVIRRLCDDSKPNQQYFIGQSTAMITTTQWCIASKSIIKQSVINFSCSEAVSCIRLVIEKKAEQPILTTALTQRRHQNDFLKLVVIRRHEVEGEFELTPPKCNKSLDYRHRLFLVLQPLDQLICARCIHEFLE